MEELADEQMRFVNEAFGEGRAAEEPAVSQEEPADALMPSPGEDTVDSEEVLQEREPAGFTAGEEPRVRKGRPNVKRKIQIRKSV